MLSKLTVNFWKFVKSGNGCSVRNLKTLLWIRGIYVELCNFHKCYAISFMCLKKKKVTWKHTNRDSCQQQTWITSLEDKVLCWSCQRSPPAEDKSNKYKRAAAHCWETISSITHLCHCLTVVQPISTHFFISRRTVLGNQSLWALVGEMSRVVN